MPQSQANVEIRNFSKGLVTEVNPLSGDISTAKHLENWILHTDGSIEARNEYTYRQQLTSNRGATDTFTPHVYIWENPAESTQPLLCVFMMQQVDIYEYDEDTGITSHIYTYSGTDVRLPMSVTEASGRMVATCEGAGASHSNTHVLTWERTGATTFTRDFKAIMINDLFGIDDGLDADEELPNTYSEGLFYESDSAAEHIQVSKHNYNLLNGGWNKEGLTKCIRQVNATILNITKATPMSIGLNSENIFSAVTAAAAMSLNGTGRIPYGSVKLNVTRRGASRDTFMQGVGISSHVYTGAERNGLSPDTEHANVSYSTAHTPTDASQSGRFIAQAHEGRVFYIGREFGVTGGDAASPDINTMLLYSQSIVDSGSMVRCHAHNDLTAIEGNAVLDTDGGFISLPNIGIVEEMKSVGNKLLIFSSTGVWEISSDTIFKSTDYSVRQITDEAVLSIDSIVLVNGNLMYWSKSGVKTMVPDDRTGRLSEQIVSVNIDTFYKTLVSANIYKAGFDKVQGIVKWLYSFDGDTEYKELHFNVKLGAFITATIGSGNLDATIEIPLAYVNVKDMSVGGDSNMELHTLNTTFTQFRTFRTNGNKAHAGMSTNVSTFGDGSKRKQATFLNMYFRQTEKSVGPIGLDDQSSCMTTVAWDFADHVDSNKFSTPFQAYRLKRVNMPTSSAPYVYGKNVVETRNKIRGSGNALDISIAAEGSHCHLYGFTLQMQGNTKT